MIGLFTSCKQDESCNNAYDATEVTHESLQNAIENISRCYTDRYELLREKATEAIVFLLADLDRSWKKNTIRCSPIAWFPKGYSLTSDTIRLLAEEVHTECFKAGIHVPCQSFDGQWHTLVVRSVKEEPLTIFQLQKDVWRQVEKTSKGAIMYELKSLNHTVVVMHIENEGKNTKSECVATNGNIRLPKYKKLNTKQTDAPKQNDNECPGTDAGQNKEVDKMVSAVFATNINEAEWQRELEDMEEEKEEIDEETETVTEQEYIPSDLTTPTYTACGGNTLTLFDMNCILSLLKTTKNTNKKGQWNNVAEEQFITYFSSVNNLKKFLDTDLRVVVKYLRKSKGLKATKESDKKVEKIKGIATFFGLNVDELPQTKPVKKIKLLPLKEMAAKIVSKYSKAELNVVMAEYYWPEAYLSWKKEIEQITLNDEDVQWFYKPEFSEIRKQTELKCIDSTHLFTRMRRKACKGGLDSLSNESWLKVAKQKQTRLTPIMVEEITDPMSAAMAATHFSHAVENKMRKNGDIEAADLCSDIRHWWESEDRGGISASDRVRMREPLRRRLLSKVDFSRFPPATQYVAGWPQQLWEATLANIDAKAYLYSLVYRGTYNVRAFSSLIGETFFSELTLNDKRGHGTLTAKEFGEFISRSTEQLQIRLDPDRTFCYCTSKTKVCDTVDEAYDESQLHDNGASVSRNPVNTIPTKITTSDNAFDMPNRRRLPGRQRIGHVSTDRNAVMKGSLGVRWEKARTNYSKMLPTKRMGLE